MSRLPTYDNCQPPDGEEPDPKQIFQWALTRLPFAGSTPLIIQPEVRPEWSELFWNLGFRHHPELQTHKIREPYRGQQHALNGSLTVVPIDDPDPDPVEIPDPAQFTVHEQAVLAERLRYSGAIPAEEPKIAKAEVISGPPFNPADHTVSAVNGYLLAPIPMGEKRRVMAAEMTGKARQGILNNPANRGL